MRASPDFDASSTAHLDAVHGGNAVYMAQLFERYRQDRQSVPPGLATYFDQFDAGDARANQGDFEGPSWQPRGNRIVAEGVGSADEAAIPSSNGQAVNGQAVSAADAGLDQGALAQAAADATRALMLIRNYRVLGHLYANLDPLGIKQRVDHPELDPASYGFTEAELDRPIFLGGQLGLEQASVRQILPVLQQIYCDKIGVEFMHIAEPMQKRWIQQRIEGIGNRTNFTPQGRQAILNALIKAEQFEIFLDRKFTGTKRFGLDGSEALIPGLEQIIKRGGQLGLKEVVLGMAHRGRLNVLANFITKPYRAVFSEFLGRSAHPEDVHGSGDVKYHLGASSDREFDGQPIHLSLAANPSHLEAVNPVVLGKVRAKQDQLKDRERRQVMGILLHGDAAFAGQGLVPESLDLSELEGYSTGGTVHVIVNNQIGFTTSPTNARSGPYCTEVAKMIEAPIFHVNGDDPEAVVHAARIASEYRMEFQKDVVLDIFCYRRFGHNEGDEPAFTQPQMYRVIKTHPTTASLYAEQLTSSGTLTKAQVETMTQDFRSLLDSEFDAAKEYKPNKADWLEGQWSGLKAVMQASGKEDARRGLTSLSDADFAALGQALSQAPDGFQLNRKLTRLLAVKAKMFASGEGFDWATAEAMALGGLLLDGAPVRFTGQDVRRGTFSQRHAVYVDQENEATYTPLNSLTPEDGAKLEIINSPLSEAGVLGFEYGYSLAEPQALTIWEAQFGDFANGAQVIIDQFIASGESKWLRMSGLVMLLPHGYEGQGPEHSSARLERFMQLSAEDNWQVVNCTTPASYFHALRRQIHRDFRKPLIIMTPKSLLRHKQAVSKAEDFLNGSSFHRVLWDTQEIPDRSRIRRVVFCSGKVYYDLVEARKEQGLDDVVILRLEQLYPFPAEAIKTELAGYRQAELVWCQEEPRNMGAWLTIAPEFEPALKAAGCQQNRLSYAGRITAASPATGSVSKHKLQQAELLQQALTGPLAV